MATAAATVTVTDLPDEVLKTVLGGVPLLESGRLAAVCPKWRELMQDCGLFTLQLTVPRLLLRAWLGSVDDDTRNGGLQLDLTRPVKLTLSGTTPKARVIGRFGVTGAAGAQSAQAEAGAPSNVELWARVVPHNVDKLRDMVEGYARGDSALLTLVGRLPDCTSGLTSWDVAKSRAGDGRMVRSLDKLVTGIGAGHLLGLHQLAAVGCRHLAWATLPPSIQLADLASCPELRNLLVKSGGSTPALHTLDLTYCCKLDPGCLPGVCGMRAVTGELPLQHLHLSWLAHIPAEVVADILRRCPKLQTVALRGIASRELLVALKAHSELRGVDCAFSAVWPRDAWDLLHLNPHLSRFNVRGCKNVSKAEYRDIVRVTANRLLSCETLACGETQQQPAIPADTLPRIMAGAEVSPLVPAL